MQIWLILHVLLGLAGTLWYGAAWLEVERRVSLVSRVRHYAAFGFTAMLLSWITAALYYTGIYGRAVRPVILEGNYPWAHTFFMETKEHLFVFIPFVALAVTMLVYILGERIWQKPELQSLTAKLMGVVVVLGSLMAVMGVVASGAVR